jgi:acyl dehydratase
MWIRDEKFGVDFGKLVHVAQAARFPNRMPPSGTIVGTAKVCSLTDRGEGRGAILVLERTIADAADGTIYCELEQTLLLRGDGGFGGPADKPREPFEFEGKTDCSATVETSQRAALIYRLSGDWNPLHLDPAFARSAGFERPILHGLASFAIAGIAASRAANEDPATISRLDCRFSGVVFPGDAMRLDVWRKGTVTHFRGFVGDRKVVDDGRIKWRKE